MKAKLLIFIFLIGVFGISFAQNNAETVIKNSRAKDNWFINIGGGGQILLGDMKPGGSFGDKISFIPGASVGKWLNPKFGVRTRGEFGSLKAVNSHNVLKDDLNYFNLHLDGMWDLTNTLGSYSPNKLFSCIPYLGIGYLHREAWEGNKVMNSLSINGGLQFGFRLSKRINLDFNLGSAFTPDNFDGVSGGFSHDVVLSAVGGLTFKLGKTDFDVVEPMDFELIEDLNAKINALRKDVDELSKRPAECPECPEIAPAIINEINYVANVVFFRINSSVVEENQQGSIFNTAQFMKDTGEKIKVIGYADKETGTDKYNLKISEKRAKAVAHELVERYNIPSQNIVIEWKGSDEQLYKKNNWNRVVIMTTN